MDINEIRKIFEKRRKDLYNMLTERSDDIKPEIQHQMYGAINEIDMFIKTLDHYRQKEVDSDLKNITLYGPDAKTPTKKNDLIKRISTIQKHLDKFKIKKRKQ